MTSLSHLHIRPFLLCVTKIVKGCVLAIARSISSLTQGYSLLQRKWGQVTFHQLCKGSTLETWFLIYSKTVLMPRTGGCRLVAHLLIQFTFIQILTYLVRITLQEIGWNKTVIQKVQLYWTLSAKSKFFPEEKFACVYAAVLKPGGHCVLSVCAWTLWALGVSGFLHNRNNGSIEGEGRMCYLFGSSEWLHFQAH